MRARQSRAKSHPARGKGPARGGQAVLVPGEWNPTRDSQRHLILGGGGGIYQAHRETAEQGAGISKGPPASRALRWPPEGDTVADSCEEVRTVVSFSRDPDLAVRRGRAQPAFFWAGVRKAAFYRRDLWSPRLPTALSPPRNPIHFS
ncbi:unnamed protein product [Rangifer tarandus platyrhynchus]|uniref:Uncharacterized protein n=1 Tax=Rangifer tarandus platyrhynchus TaxID=3082113 RepID=A0AC59Z2F1_RANTA